MIQISKQQARHFLLKKQLLLPPYSLKGNAAIEKVFNMLRLIQFDPLNPCGRNPDLVLQARVEDYHPEDYFRWLYQEKKGIECYDKELCILPIEDFPLTAPRRATAATNQRIVDLMKIYKKDFQELMIRIKKEGPLSSSEITETRRADSGWGDQAKLGRVALEALWKLGRIVVVKREGGKKYYDVPAKWFGKQLSFSPFKAITSDHVIKRLRSVGMLPRSGTGSGWQGIASAVEMKKIIGELVEAKILLEVAVRDSKTRYVILKDDESLIQKKVYSITNPKMIFVAPLDNLIWDRNMIEDFFGFQYRWEVYVPLAKRKYGYYALPILYGDRFIGRIEPFLRKDNLLEIKGIWKECVWNERQEKTFTETLERFRAYLKADKVVIK